MPDRLDPTFLRATIENLRATWPQIAEDEDQWLLALESQTDLPEFASAVVRRMRKAEANAKGARADADEYAAPLMLRAARFDQRSQALRGLMFKLLMQAGLKKLELAAATLSIRAGQPRVIITDEAALPEYAVRIKREPNKLVIKDRLERGEPVPGATLSNSEETLAVRVK